MVYIFRFSIYRFYSVFNISKSRTMNMDKCYFRYIKKDDKVDISFLMKIKESVRQFNFSRNPSESLQVLFSRIETNIKKVIMKANKKKSNPDDSSITVNLIDCDPESQKNYTCEELFTMEGPVKLKIYDAVYEAVFNPPWILNIELPHSILAGFPVYPEYFEIQYAAKDKCLFNWYTGTTINSKGNPIIDMHIQWELVGNGFSYTPVADDIGKKLKVECTPGNGITTGPAVEGISKNIIEAGPGKCPFETRHMFTSEKLQGKSFRCVSYNILADLYCDSDYTRSVLHPYCPPYALHIDYRKQLIIKELIGYNADIMCLQEVDSKIFRHCLVPILESKGFAGLFYKKGKEVAEGLACYYRKDRFITIGDESIVLSEAVKSLPCLATIWDAIKDNQPLLDRFLDRSTVASATFLQSVDNHNEILIIGNTHLYFHPDADHIRLLQGGVLINWLMNVKKDMMRKYPKKRVSLILSGDFNSVPSCGIYQLYTTGCAPSNLPDWKSNANEAISELNLTQDISLESACGTPKFTNFTDAFADCLDYIYYEKTNLVVDQVVPFPSEEELKSNIALPSIVFPSDHLALISDLRFK